MCVSTIHACTKIGLNVDKIADDMKDVCECDGGVGMEKRDHGGDGVRTK